MTPTQEDIAALEERMRLAELTHDAAFFQEFLSEDVVLTAQDGKSFGKAKVVDAHRPGKGATFTDVVMSDRVIIDHGAAAVVTCKGAFTGPQFTGTLRFLRVWVKRDGRWQIVAGAVFNA